jgi:hypothetical protein
MAVLFSEHVQPLLHIGPLDNAVAANLCQIRLQDARVSLSEGPGPQLLNKGVVLFEERCDWLQRAAEKLYSRVAKSRAGVIPRSSCT